jgi:hypothetical protein
VTNRGDSNGDRLNGFYVYIDGSECASNVQIGSGETLDVDCVGAGQVVKIMLNQADSGVKHALTICEVVVLPATVVDSTTTSTTVTTVTTTTIFKHPWQQAVCPGRSADNTKNNQANDAYWEKKNPDAHEVVKPMLPGELDDEYDFSLLLHEGYAMYYTIDEEMEEMDIAIHCNSCPGWMGIGFPNYKSGNSGNNMVMSHAVIATCKAGEPVDVFEYQLTGYVKSGVNKLAEQALTEIACKVSGLGKTVTFKRPKETSDYRILVGDPDAGKVLWALGLSDELAFHGASTIKVAGGGEIVGVEEESDPDSAAGMGSLYWPVPALPDGAPPTTAPPATVGGGGGSDSGGVETVSPAPTAAPTDTTGGNDVPSSSPTAQPDKATVKTAVGNLLAAAGVHTDTADALKNAIEAMDEETFAAVLDDAGDVVMSAVLANEDVVAALMDAGVDLSDITLMASLGAEDDATEAPNTSSAAPTARIVVGTAAAIVFALALVAAGVAV